MATLQQRNRMVVFRLTEQEYNNLRSACNAAGGRSLSDFTRSELFTVVQSDGQGAALERKFLEIDRKLNDLYSLIERMFERITPPEMSLTGGQNGSGRE